MTEQLQGYEKAREYYNSVRDDLGIFEAGDVDYLQFAIRTLEWQVFRCNQRFPMFRLLSLRASLFDRGIQMETNVAALIETANKAIDRAELYALHIHSTAKERDALPLLKRGSQNMILRSLLKTEYLTVLRAIKVLKRAKAIVEES